MKYKSLDYPPKFLNKINEWLSMGVETYDAGIGNSKALFRASVPKYL